MLRVVCGPMFSGKTSEALRFVRRLRAIGWDVLVVNHRLDDRGGDAAVRSHDAHREEGTLSLSRLDGPDLWERVGRHQAVVVDEAQFFGEELVPSVRRMVQTEGKHVLVVGLDGDHRQQGFGHLAGLLPLADEFVKLRAFCAVCQDGTPAPFTRLRPGVEPTRGGGPRVGAGETYEPVCRRHLQEEEAADAS